METLIQQLINGLVIGSVYALVALGYTMVYGILGMINFAHGEVLMIGALTALQTMTFLMGVAPGMSPVAKVLFAADALEPGRRGDGLDELRRRAHADLDRALREIIERTIVALIEGGRLIHPHSVATRNDLVVRAGK